MRQRSHRDSFEFTEQGLEVEGAHRTVRASVLEDVFLNGVEASEAVKFGVSASDVTRSCCEHDDFFEG